MRLDIRTPLGLIFLIVGALLALYGAFTRHSSIYARSLGINLNFYWGLAMVVFGAIMYIAARRSRRHGALS